MQTLSEAQRLLPLLINLLRRLKALGLSVATTTTKPETIDIHIEGLSLTEDQVI